METAATFDLDHKNRESLLPQVAQGLNEVLHSLPKYNLRHVNFLDLATSVNKVVTAGEHEGETSGGFFYTMLGDSFQVWDRYAGSDKTLQEVGTKLLTSDRQSELSERAYRLIFLAHHFYDGNGRTARAIREVLKSVYESGKEFDEETIRPVLGVDKRAAVETAEGVLPDPEVEANYVSLVDALGKFVESKYPNLQFDKELIALPVKAIETLSSQVTKRSTIQEIMDSDVIATAEKMVQERNTRLTPVELQIWGERIGLGKSMEAIVESLIDSQLTEKLFSKDFQDQLPSEDRQFLTKTLLQGIIIKELKSIDLINTGVAAIGGASLQKAKFSHITDKDLEQIVDIFYGVFVNDGVKKKAGINERKIAREFIEYYVLEDELK